MRRIRGYLHSSRLAVSRWKGPESSSYLLPEAGGLSNSSLALMGWLADASGASGLQSTLEAQRHGVSKSAKGSHSRVRGPASG